VYFDSGEIGTVPSKRGDTTLVERLDDELRHEAQLLVAEGLPLFFGPMLERFGHSSAVSIRGSMRA
jgi:hypothetical protein